MRLELERIFFLLLNNTSAVVFVVELGCGHSST